MELFTKAAMVGLPEPYFNGFWASDPPYKYRGKWYGIWVNIDTGAARSVRAGTPRNGWYGSVGRAIVVRQASSLP